MFGRGNWVKIEGLILASKHTGVGASHGIGGQKEYVVEYTAGGTTKRVELKQVMGLNSYKMKSPNIGSSVPLLFDERSGKVKFDIEDTRLALDNSDFLREDSKADRDAYKSALKGAIVATSGDQAHGSGGHEGEHVDPRLRRARVALREARRRGDPAEIERLAAELDDLEHGRTAARSEPQGHSGVEPIEQRLAKLERLRDGGILTPEEYTAQRQRILDSL